MKVILDGVFNHCGSFNKWLDREEIYQVSGDYEDGAFVSKDSPYRNFFGFQDQFAWPYNTTYEGWWGHDTLPKLNYEGSENCMMILCVLQQNGYLRHTMRTAGDLMLLQI